MGIEHSDNQNNRELTLTFSNGAYTQLEELQKIYELKEISEVVELAINVLDLAKNKKMYIEGDDGDKQLVRIKKS